MKTRCLSAFICVHQRAINDFFTASNGRGSDRSRARGTLWVGSVYELVAPVLDYFFLDPAFLAGAGPQGVVFRFSTFAFSVSMVSMNGSLVNAFGTPVH